jgi:tetratricopeptide (TPR) repeat protein
MIDEDRPGAVGTVGWFVRLSLLAIVPALFLTIGCGGISGSPDLQDTDPLSSDRLRLAGLDSAAITLVRDARAAADRNRYGAALSLADSLIRREEEHPEGYLLRGTIYMQVDRTPQARRSFERAIEIDSTYAPAHRWMGELLEGEDELEEAIDYWETALSLRPERDYYRYVLGTLYFKTGRMGQALAELEPLADRRPAHVHTVLGRIFVERGEWSRARQHFRDAITADSTHADAHFYLSESFEEAGEFARALPPARRALDLRPEKLQYRYHVGQLLVEMGRLDEGARVLAEVLQSDSTHRGALYNRAQTLRRLGRESEADVLSARLDTLQELDNRIKRLETSVRTQEDDPQMWLRLARLLERAGRMDRAIESYMHAASLAPSNLALANNIANLLLVRGDTTQALSIYQTILRRDSTVATAWLNLGVVYANRGRTAEARKAWNRVLELEPRHETARVYLERLD